MASSPPPKLQVSPFKGSETNVKILELAFLFWKDELRSPDSEFPMDFGRPSLQVALRFHRSHVLIISTEVSQDECLSVLRFTDFPWI